eukprot:TRINITY_DN1499_c0_g1_i1.p1 TRINITY_DN1499_c0_g1~~TRINITY_DN1499_c0_g1_i1.p1  ORF type:complete len:331 (-),score=42.72 TRINITY_DN1499_c0_g1_i1:16-1008(-)
MEMNQSDGKKEKRKIVACNPCNIGHRKCDGQVPCQNCVKRKIECTKNQKRKPIGRPRTRDIDKKSRSDTMICYQCKTNIHVDSRFCNFCGNKMMNPTELLKEIDLLKKKVLELTQIIELRGSMTDIIVHDMTILNKIEKMNCTFPFPSFISDISPTFLNMLGYNQQDFSNSYYPDLIHTNHHQSIAGRMRFKVVEVKGIVEPKLCFEEHIFLRMKNGNYLHFISNSTSFFDLRKNIIYLYSIRVKKICEMNLHESSLPPAMLPSFLTFYCENTADAPNFEDLHRKSIVSSHELHLSAENINLSNNFLLNNENNLSSFLDNPFEVDNYFNF